MSDAVTSGASFLAILNPFALSLYLWVLMTGIERAEFFRVLLQATLISLAIFCVFAVAGERMLDLLGIDAGALRLFGGLVFLMIALKYVSHGYRAVESLRGSITELPSAIAVPFMIGAGTITQAILIGKRHDLPIALTILAAVIALSLLVITAFYFINARLTPRYESAFNRYVNMLARLNGLIIGAFSVKMIFEGARIMLQHEGLLP